MARGREEHGIPLDALYLHYNPRCMDVVECLLELKEFVGDVKLWGFANLPDRWTSNALLGAWEAAGYPGPVSFQSYRGSGIRLADRFLRRPLVGYR